MTSNKPSNFITETKNWEVYLNPDQYYLGRCVIAAKRDIGAISELTNDEWLDFSKLVKKMESGFKSTFGATMFNWSCLMNDAYKQEQPHPEVHWHFRPRYKNPVEFLGMIFEDKEFGHHYARHTESRVSPEIENQVISKIREFINK